MGVNMFHLKGLSPPPISTSGFRGPCPTVQQSYPLHTTIHEVCEGEMKYAWFELLSHAVFFFIPHTTASVTFICTNKCNIMHAFQERPSKTVDFSPCLETLLPSGVVGRDVIWTSLFQAYPGLGDDVDGRVWHSCRRVCVCKCFLLNYVIFP